MGYEVNMSNKITARVMSRFLHNVNALGVDQNGILFKGITHYLYLQVFSKRTFPDMQVCQKTYHWYLL